MILRFIYDFLQNNVLDEQMIVLDVLRKTEGVYLVHEKLVVMLEQDYLLEKIQK